ncbi:hypothetical protein HDZ31DRAFT_79069 [Schizophyllum fasciatum]
MLESTQSHSFGAQNPRCLNSCAVDDPITGCGERRSQPRNCYIDRLPTEILCAIFMMCGETDEIFFYPRYDFETRKPPPPVMPYSQAAVLLGYVCTRWFTATRCYPRLWTMVDVSYPQSSDVALLGLCLRYSNGFPLVLRFNGRHYKPPRVRNTQAYPQFMRLVASAAHRWEEISFVVTAHPFEAFDGIKYLLELPPDAFSSLRRAMLHLCDDPQCASQLWTMFFESPVLHMAQWFGNRIQIPSSTRLTHVAANFMPPEIVMDFLQSSPQLEVLRAIIHSDEAYFLGVNDGVCIHNMPVPIRMPNLRVLMMSGMYDWSNLLNGISVPLLTRLELGFAGMQVGMVEAMLQRSNARLVMLGIQSIYIEDKDRSIALLGSALLQSLSIFFYQRHGTHMDSDSPKYFDPIPFLPQQLVLFTKDYTQADNMYWGMVDM